VKKLSALIVDDEPLARSTLRLLLSGDPGIIIAGESGDGEDAVRQIRQKSPDIVFLDVQMPGMDGFKVLESVGVDAVPAVVFVTAFDRYALRAFDAGAVDYLLKPFEDRRFRRSLARAKSSLGAREAAASSRRLAALLASLGGRAPAEMPPADAPAAGGGRLAVKQRGRIIVLKQDEIDWIAAADYCVTIHAGHTKYLHRETLGSILKKLEAGKFFRIHRSTIVNLARIKEIRPGANGDFTVSLTTGTALKLSRSRRGLLKDLL
jgi:two-component system, LytTR family, response regulator